MKILKKFSKLPLATLAMLTILVLGAAPVFAFDDCAEFGDCDVAAVPEPASLALVGLGLAGLAGKALTDRRRKK